MVSFQDYKIPTISYKDRKLLRILINQGSLKPEKLQRLLSKQYLEVDEQGQYRLSLLGQYALQIDEQLKNGGLDDQKASRTRSRESIKDRAPSEDS